MATSMKSESDVVILGGGPAGTAAAIVMARAGLDVTVLERTGYQQQRIGETLPPTAKPLLHFLGVWDAFQADSHVESPGIVAAWEREVPHENDFLFNPYGCGWHLDRVRFDRMLADQCEHAGAVLFRESRVRSCTQQHGTRWLLTFEAGLVQHEITATILIDATGRSAWLAQSQGAKRIVLDQLVGVIGFCEGSETEERRTLIEAVHDGWWYAARLSNRIVAAFMTDADLIPRGQHDLRYFWQQRLRDAPLPRSLLANVSDVGTLKVKMSGTTRLDHFHGVGWLAVGDATLAFDPLSSLGIVKALESGWRAATQVVASLQGTSDAMAPYAAWLESEFAAYLRNYDLHYHLVRRWPNSAFWKRRQSA